MLTKVKVESPAIVTSSDKSKIKKKDRSYQPGQPRHHCDYEGCTASFARMEHLKRHKSVHDPSISFPCEYCKREFARKDILKRHLRRQHAEESGETPLPKKSAKSSNDNK